MNSLRNILAYEEQCESICEIFVLRLREVYGLSVEKDISNIEKAEMLSKCIPNSDGDLKSVFMSEPTRFDCDNDRLVWRLLRWLYAKLEVNVSEYKLETIKDDILKIMKILQYRSTYYKSAGMSLIKSRINTLTKENSILERRYDTTVIDSINFNGFSQIRGISILGDNNTSEYEEYLDLAERYLESAKLLQNGDTTKLVALFCYRHCIELCLKSLAILKQKDFFNNYKEAVKSHELTIIFKHLSGIMSSMHTKFRDKFKVVELLLDSLAKAEQFTGENIYRYPIQGYVYDCEADLSEFAEFCNMLLKFCNEFARYANGELVIKG